MREIKFRFWNKKEKKMEMFMQLHNSDMFTHENFIPLQYTGLKDKNGKEIYEGDILSDLEVLGTDENGNEEISYHVVAWDDDRCFFGLLGFDDPVVVVFDEYDMDELEIIGNIYEDKDNFDLSDFRLWMFDGYE